MAIEIGSIVQLKSGGPNMTVVGFLDKQSGDTYLKGIRITIANKSDVNSNEYVICKWFDNQSKYITDVFDMRIIEEK